MQKPNNYEETQAQGEWTPVELGGHKMIIKQVSEKQSQNGKPMIVVLFDFAPDDKQPNYFMDSFQNDSRPDKKWSNQGTQYILTEDQDIEVLRTLAKRRMNSDGRSGRKVLQEFQNVLHLRRKFQHRIHLLEE